MEESSPKEFADRKLHEVIEFMRDVVVSLAVKGLFGPGQPVSKPGPILHSEFPGHVIADQASRLRMTKKLELDSTPQ